MARSSNSSPAGLIIVWGLLFAVVVGGFIGWLTYNPRPEPKTITPAEVLYLEDNWMIRPKTTFRTDRGEVLSFVGVFGRVGERGELCYHGDEVLYFDVQRFFSGSHDSLITLKEEQ